MKMWNWKYYLASMWNRICSCFWQHIPILFDIPSLLKSDQTKRKNLICNILQAVWRSETLCTKLDPRVHHSCPSRSCLRLKSIVYFIKCLSSSLFLDYLCPSFQLTCGTLANIMAEMFQISFLQLQGFPFGATSFYRSWQVRISLAVCL